MFLSCLGKRKTTKGGVARLVQQSAVLRCCGGPSSMSLGPPAEDPLAEIQARSGSIYRFPDLGPAGRVEGWSNDTLVLVLALGNVSHPYEGGEK